MSSSATPSKMAAVARPCIAVAQQRAQQQRASLNFSKEKNGSFRAQTWKFTRVCHYTSTGGESRASRQARRWVLCGWYCVCVCVCVSVCRAVCVAAGV